MGGGVKITFDAGVLEGIDLDYEVNVYWQNNDGSITDTYNFYSSQLTDFSFVDKKGVISPSGWAMQIKVPNTRASRDAYKYGIQMSINGIIIGSVTAQSVGEQIEFTIMYVQQNIETIDLKIVYTDNYICDEDVVINLVKDAQTQISCPSFMPNMQYKFVFEIGELTDPTYEYVIPKTGKYVTEALTIVNGTNNLLKFTINNVVLTYIKLQYDSDDNIYLYSNNGVPFFNSITLTGVIAVPMTTLSPGYIVLDFNDGFIDRYDPYYVGVSNWNDVADYIWADVINNNQINLQITTNDDYFDFNPEKVSSDGRYLYFDVSGVGTDVYIETVIYQDPIIGEEYQYQNPNVTTYIGNYIANKGMRGSIENSALVLNES